MQVYQIKTVLGKLLYEGQGEILKDVVCKAVNSGAYLDGANLARANLAGAYLARANLDGANLDGAYLARANLDGAYLARANLARANLDGANLDGAYLAGAYLARANLDGANLDGAYLDGAYLDGAYLDGANLARANLAGAYLARANLARANLARAYLDGAYLDGAYLDGAKGIKPWRADSLRMLFDQPGKIRAYKIVNEKMEGIYNGGLKYNIGAKLEEIDACTDENIQCAKGINLATLNWCMREWHQGRKIMICEFEAKDIAAIPIGTDGKFRVFRCEVVDEKDLTEIGLVEKKEETEIPSPDAARS